MHKLNNWRKLRKGFKYKYVEWGRDEHITEWEPTEDFLYGVAFLEFYKIMKSLKALHRLLTVVMADSDMLEIMQMFQSFLLISLATFMFLQMSEYFLL